MVAWITAGGAVKRRNGFRGGNDESARSPYGLRETRSPYGLRDDNPGDESRPANGLREATIPATMSEVAIIPRVAKAGGRGGIEDVADGGNTASGDVATGDDRFAAGGIVAVGDNAAAGSIVAASGCVVAD